MSTETERPPAPGGFLARRRLCALALSVIALSGCAFFTEEPRDGQLTVANDSDRAILFVSGRDFEAAIGQRSRVAYQPFAVGSQPRTRTYDVRTPRPGDDEPWCVNQTYWVLGHNGPDPADPDFFGDPPYDADQFIILDQLGPGHCWSGRFDEYRFAG